MRVEPLRSDLLRYITKRGLKKKFDKQIAIFKENPRYPSLHTERLESKRLRIYSFRIDRQYRVIFIFTAIEEIEIVDINNHYQ